MTTSNATSVTPRDVARILFRHRKGMAVSFCSLLLLTLAVIALYPRSFSSEAKLLIRIGRESVGLDPTATTGETILLQKTQVDEINSALNILTGRAVLQRVVDKVGAERILKDAAASEAGQGGSNSWMAPFRAAAGGVTSAIGSGFEMIGLSDPGTTDDRAIRRLERYVGASAPKDSTVISVSYRAASPELARDVVAAVTDAFMELHVQLSQTEGSLEFFVEQVNGLHDELTKAEDELRDRRNAFQWTSHGGRRSIVEQSKEGMLQKVYDLQVLENDLSARYTDEYPPLKEIRRQREEAEQVLVQMPIERADGIASQAAGQSGATIKATPAIAVSQAVHSTEVDAARSSRANAELRMLNGQQLELAQLERKVELLDAKYRMHVDKLEQARVNDALGRDRITNIKVAQPATFETKPVAPQKALLLALGLVSALGGAIGLAYVTESCDQTLRTTDQIEKELGIPVLLSLPQRKPRRNHNKANGSVPAGNGVGNGKAQAQRGQLGDYRPLLRELIARVDEGSNGARRATTVGVIGCESSRLRSRVAGDLAIQAAANCREPVLLIDTDARHRRVARRFNINGSPGWREVLSGEANAENCVYRQEAIDLSVMPPGTSNGHEPNARPANVSRSQIDEIKNDYGLVVVDLPAVRDLDTAPTSTEWLDETVLVVEAERTRVQAAQRAKEALERAGMRIVGVVLANRREHIPRWLYQRL